MEFLRLIKTKREQDERKSSKFEEFFEKEIFSGFKFKKLTSVLRRRRKELGGERWDARVLIEGLVGWLIWSSFFVRKNVFLCGGVCDLLKRNDFSTKLIHRIRFWAVFVELGFKFVQNPWAVKRNTNCIEIYLKIQLKAHFLLNNST